MKTCIVAAALRLMMSALVVLMLSACTTEDGSVGGGNTAGIGGSGFISTGTVTGFGSVFVNGVEFATDATIFDIEDNSGSQSDLRVGMVVQIEGSINSDGVTGTATSLQYSDDIQGPVGSVLSDNLIKKTFTILGKTVIVSVSDTVYEGVTYNTITSGNVLEVSGFYDQNGAIRASYIELKADTFDASTIIEVKGVITGLSGTTFTVQGITVDAGATNLSDLPSGLQENVLVEVKGTYDSATHTITAREVDAENNELSSDASSVEIEGLITRFVSINDFDINGIRVNGSAATLSPSSLQLKPDVKVEVEGSMQNGVLIATKIEGRSGSAEASAKVDSINLQGNSFTLSIVAGQPSVIVQLTSATRMEDDLGEGDSFLLSDLAINNFVDVRGFETDTTTNTITATRIKRESEVKDIILQGVVTAQVKNVSVTVLGVTFPVHPVTTDFEDANDNALDNHAAFIALATLGQTVVEIKDRSPSEDGNAVGVADTVEIED